MRNVELETQSKESSEKSTAASPCSSSKGTRWKNALSSFFLFILSSLRLQAISCTVICYDPISKTPFSSNRYFLYSSCIIASFFNEYEIRILEVKKNCQMDKNKLVPLENLVRRIKRWRFTMCIIFMGNHALEQDVSSLQIRKIIRSSGVSVS